MADCPKCHKHLKITDWRQHCPYCGANIVVYDLQERLMQEADIAEVQNYHFQKKIDRLKASFVGSKLAIVRIFTSLLPVAAIFLPLFNGVAKEPLDPVEGKFTFLTIYNHIDSIGGLLNYADSASPKAGLMLLIAAALFVLSVVLILVHFILLILACSPKAKPRNITLGVLLLATSIGSVAVFAAMPAGGMVEGTLGIGAYLYILLQLVNVVVDIAVLKQGIEIHHKQCYVGAIPIEEYFEMVESGLSTEAIRAEQYKRLAAEQEEKEAEIRAKEEATAKKEGEKLNG